MKISNNTIFDFVIVGGGLLGLATAHNLLLREPSLNIVVLEKEKELVAHQSGHNSGVIHSGVYYKPLSNKAKMCIDGYSKMIAFCRNYNIEYNLCGKMIVAVHENEIVALHNIFKNGIKNGLTNLELLDETEISTKEKNIRGIKALHVPQTGVVDYKKVGKKLGEIIEGNNGIIIKEFKVSGIEHVNKSIIIKSNRERIKGKFMINCAGLYADHIALLSGASIQHRIVPFRGEYYQVNASKHTSIDTLIYPVPNAKYPFLGVHFTKSIEGKLEIGPNAVLSHSREGYLHSKVNFQELFSTLTYKGFLKFAAKNLSYGVREYLDSKSKSRYVKNAKTMMPGLKKRNITKSRAGIRAQACDYNGNLIEDFLFIHQEQALHVCNAPSPAATSCFAIADKIIEQTKLT